MVKRSLIRSSKNQMTLSGSSKVPDFIFIYPINTELDSLADELDRRLAALE